MLQVGMDIDRRQTPHRSVAADVSRLKPHPWPASKGTHWKRSDPAHAGCYKVGMDIDRRQTPHRSVAADVSRLKPHPWPASKGTHWNRSDPAHAGCYKSAWTSIGAK